MYRGILWQKMKLAHYAWRVENPQAPAMPSAWALARKKLAEGRALVGPAFMARKPGPGSPYTAAQLGQLRGVFVLLCLYFSKDARFLELNPRYSFDKGILLQGGLGLGKTTLLELFAENPRRGYHVLATTDINQEYKKHGPKAVEALEKPQAFAFDDLGQESTTVQWMGNYDTVLEEILNERYRLQKRYPTKGPLCHASTNLPVKPQPEWEGPETSWPHTLLAQYGNRVVDRFREMFNQVVMPAMPSFR